MDEGVARAQIKRLSALPGLPKEADGRAELIRALVNGCTSDAHMAATIDRILEVEERCPTPASIRHVAAELSASYSTDSPGGCCQVCRDLSGWRRAFDIRQARHGERVRLVRSDEADWSGVMAEGQRLKDEYAGHEICEVLVACRCPLGQLRFEEQRARESSRDGAR